MRDVDGIKRSADTRQSLDVFKGRISCALTRPEPRFQSFFDSEGLWPRLLRYGMDEKGGQDPAATIHYSCPKMTVKYSLYATCVERGQTP